MNGIKRSFLFLCLCMGLLSCGCQETPEKAPENTEQVKDNANQQGDNHQTQDSEITYCTVAELREVKIPKVEQFPDTVDFSRVEGVELLHLSVEKNFLSEDNIKKYAELFGVERKKLKKTESEGEWGRTINYNGKHGFLSVSDTGGVVQMFGFSYNVPENVVEKKYNMDEEDVSKVKVHLADGKVNLAKFCKNTERWLEEHMPIDGIRYKVSDVYVRKEKKIAKDDPTRVMSLCAEYDYKGIRLNNHTVPLNKEDQESKKVFTTSLSIMMDYETQGLPCFFSRESSFTVDSSEPVEKVVDLASAVRLAKKKLSGIGSVHITKVLPLYALYMEEEVQRTGTEIEARPVYAFLVEEEKEPQSIGIIKSENCKTFLYVDMITGEVTTRMERLF